MPTSKTKMKNAAIAAKSAALPEIPKELLDQFVSGPMTGEAVNAESMALKKALIERTLGAELGHQLGYTTGSAQPGAVSDQRNGSSGKTVLTENGPLRIPEHERRFTGFDDEIIAMYARGMTMREVQGLLADQDGVEVSPEFISSVTDAVTAEVGAWQARPLEPIHETHDPTGGASGGPAEANVQRTSRTDELSNPPRTQKCGHSRPRAAGLYQPLSADPPRHRSRPLGFVGAVKGSLVATSAQRRPM